MRIHKGRRIAPFLHKKHKKRSNAAYPPGGAGQQDEESVLLGLSTALCIHILTWLGESDLHCVMQVNSHFHCLLRHPHDSDYLWQGLLEQRWPYLQQEAQERGAPGRAHNKRHLLQLAAPTLPPSDVTWVSDGLQRCDEERTVVRFTGPIGTGDRSLRANLPLPRPCERPCRKLNLLRRLFRGRGRRRTASKPFVVPFSSCQDVGFCMTPRLISYFEVSVLDSGGNNNEDNLGCVAVGISTHRFSLHRRLPGWDDWSFGYHSDDGLIFHGRGNSSKYGPVFGPGNTVGCGLDYAAGGRLFYTLDGRFLGYAALLSDDQLALDWFPTVGLDCHVAVRCNFGTCVDQPFVFDLARMVDSQNQRRTGDFAHALYTGR